MPLLPPKGTSMTATAIANIDDRKTAAEAFPYWVLLGPPTIRTIPIFSLQGEAVRSANEVWAVSTKDEGNTIDKQALGRLRAGAFGDHRFIITRHRRGARTACYATWLSFSDQEKATAFVTTFPRYGLSNLLADAQRRIGTIEHDLQQGLSKGRFDLSVIDENARYKRAQLYVTSVEQVQRLRATQRALEHVRGGVREWFGSFGSV